MIGAYANALAALFVQESSSPELARAWWRFNLNSARASVCLLASEPAKLEGED